MSDIVNEFNDYCSKMNAGILADNNKVIKRIFNLETIHYEFYNALENQIIL